jgi:hypothetical protein
VLTFLFTPDLVNEPKKQDQGGTTINAPGGVGAGTISGGNFNINPPPKSAPSPSQ